MFGMLLPDVWGCSEWVSGGGVFGPSQELSERGCD